MTGFKRLSATLLRRVFMVSMVAAAILGWTAQNAVQAGNSDPWTVTEVNGTALVSHDGAGWQPASTGDVLRPGSRMKTGRDGRAVLKRPGDSLAVSPGSSFAIPGGGEKRPLGNIVQSLGTLLFKVKTRPQDPFNVKTPYLAAVIRGTTFTVSVDDSNAALHVAKGAVEVTSVLSGQTVLVRPGETAVVNPRAGGALKLVGRSNRRHQTRIKKSGKRAAAAKDAAKTRRADAVKRADAAKLRSSEAGRKAVDRLSDITGSSSGSAGKSAANSGRTHYRIPRRLGDRRVSINRLTRGLVNDTSGPKHRKQGRRRGRHGKSGTFANRDAGNGIGIGNGSGNGGVSNGVGNDGLSNGTGNSGFKTDLGAGIGGGEGSGVDTGTAADTSGGGLGGISSSGPGGGASIDSGSGGSIGSGPGGGSISSSGSGGGVSINSGPGGSSISSSGPGSGGISSVLKSATDDSASGRGRGRGRGRGKGNQ